MIIEAFFSKRVLIESFGYSKKCHIWNAQKTMYCGLGTMGSHKFVIPSLSAGYQKVCAVCMLEKGCGCWSGKFDLLLMSFMEVNRKENQTSLFRQTPSESTCFDL